MYPAARRIFLPDEREPVGILKWERLEQDSVNSGKDHRVGANAERQSEYGNRGEARTLSKCPQCQANVLPQVVPPEPTAGFVKTLLGLLDVSEGPARGGSCLHLAQPLFPPALDLKLNVGLDFGIEI